MATASTFSYAQAAKGQGGPPSTGASPAQSAVGTSQSSDSHEATNTQPQAENDSTGSHPAVNGTGDKETPAEIKEEAAQSVDSTAQNATNPPNRQSSAASVTGSRRDDDEAATEGSARRSDKSAARSPSSSTRVTDDTETKKGSRKPRKGKGAGESEKNKDKDTEKEKEKEQPKIELIEASIPSVNIWAQRKEAQASKVKPVASAASTPARSSISATGPVESWNHTQDSKKKAKPAPEAAAASDVGAKSSRKPEDSRGDGEAPVRRGGPRGSRLGDKSGAPPPVGDAAYWPTPEIATKEEKKKTVDRVERPDQPEVQEDIGGSKSKRKDQWERIDFVPTVNWETPIPAPRGTRGGRAGPGSRPGRDATPRGSNAQSATTADKSAEAATTAATAAVKGVAEHREKPRDGVAAARAASLPPATKQTPADAPRARDQRKPVSSTRSERPRDAALGSSTDNTIPRGEGRGERGRGGFHRGRGGHANPSASSHTQQSSYMANGGPFSPQQSGPSRHQFSSPPLSQTNSFSGFGHSHGRQSGRGNRGQAGSGYNPRGTGPNGNASRPRPLSTTGNFVPYQWETYAGMPMTAPAYPTQPPMNFEYKAVLTQQVEYYFSVNNLCKDFHLRSQMDSQGFVFVSVIDGFARVKQLTGNNYPLLRAACADSTLVDFVAGSDGLERLRARTHWQKFILPIDKRVESAQNHGPDGFFCLNVDQQSPHAAMNGIPTGGYGMAPPASYTNGGGIDASVFMNGAHPHDGNGQLSATVPEFQPGGFNGQPFSQDANGTDSSPPSDAPNGSVKTTAAAEPMVNGTAHEEPQPSESLQS